MRKSINSINDLHNYREELLSLRNKQRAEFALGVENFLRPFSIAQAVAKKISMIPIAISVAKVVFSILRKKK